MPKFLIDRKSYKLIVRTKINQYQDYPHENLNNIFIIPKIYSIEIDALASILVFFLQENVLVKEKLQVFVSCVDAKLLEAIDLKILETGHV
jgi:hypothetical protein